MDACGEGFPSTFSGQPRVAVASVIVRMTSLMQVSFCLNTKRPLRSVFVGHASAAVSGLCSQASKARPSALSVAVRFSQCGTVLWTSAARDVLRSCLCLTTRVPALPQFSPAHPDPWCQLLRRVNANTAAATQAPRPPSHSARRPSHRFRLPSRRIAPGCRAPSRAPPRGPHIRPARYSNCQRHEPRIPCPVPRRQSASIRAVNPNSQTCPRQTRNPASSLPLPPRPQTPPLPSVPLLPRLTRQTSRPAPAGPAQAPLPPQSTPHSQRDRQNYAHLPACRRAAGIPWEWSRSPLRQFPVSRSLLSFLF